MSAQHGSVSNPKSIMSQPNKEQPAVEGGSEEQSGKTIAGTSIK